MTTNDLMTVTQAAVELGLSARAVQHRIKNGTLPAQKLGTGRTSAYVLDRSDVARLKRQLLGKPAAAS